MKFIELPLAGAFLILLEHKIDHRGYFARTFCIEEFSEAGLKTQFLQCSTSFNLKRGLIRGMHFQENPFAETKLVRCTQGKIWDVLIDLRENSPTFQQWHAEELSQQNGKMLYIPQGFAHGYQVLENHSEVFYMMDEMYHPDAAREISPFSIPHLNWPLSTMEAE